MESLQLAQMLADINNLNAADSRAAVELVTANKTLAHPVTRTGGAATCASSPGQDTLKPPEHRHHQRVKSASASISRSGSPLDSFSRRLLTPPITRSNSSQGSIPGTPRKDGEVEGDIDRASTLMALYDIREKLKHQDNAGLKKAREKIAALAVKRPTPNEKDKSGSPPSKANAQYTYPKQT